jgi:hypothetical protein
MNYYLSDNTCNYKRVHASTRYGSILPFTFDDRALFQLYLVISFVVKYNHVFIRQMLPFEGVVCTPVQKKNKVKMLLFVYIFCLYRGLRWGTFLVCTGGPGIKSALRSSILGLASS